VYNLPDVGLDIYWFRLNLAVVNSRDSQFAGIVTSPGLVITAWLRILLGVKDGSNTD
jgi:hypothetical protein